MRSSNLILLHWNNEYQHFKKNLTVGRKKGDSEAIHEVRVTIKKLRAYLKLLLIFTNKKTEDELFAKTEELFKVLGRHRDVEISLELTSQYEKKIKEKYPELKSFFEKQKEQTLLWSVKALNKYRDKELKHIGKLIAKSPGLAEDEIVIQKIASLIITSLLLAKENFAVPHKLRQELKEVYYWIKMLPEKHFLKPLEDKLHDLLDDFGYWQDHQVFITRAKHFRKDYLPGSFGEFDKLKQLQATANDTAEDLLKSGMKKTKKVMAEVSKLNKLEPA